MKPKLNYLYVGPAYLAFTAAIAYIAWSTWGLYVRDLPRNADFIYFVLLELFCLFAFLGLSWKLYADAHLAMDPGGVSRPSLFGVTSFRWKEVTRLRQYGYGLHIHGDKGRIVVSPFVYQDHEGVVDYFNKRLEEVGVRLEDE